MMKRKNRKLLNRLEDGQNSPPKRGWTAVSESPQGTYFLSSENSFSVTTSREDAVVFHDYENAVACLEHFLENIFIANKREGDIIHFFRIEKIEKI